MRLFLKKKRSLLLVIVLISLLAVVGCSSSSTNDEELSNTGTAEMKINVESFVPESQEAEIATQALEFNAEQLVVTVEKANGDGESKKETIDLSNDKKAVTFSGLNGGEDYNIEVAAVEAEYNLYSAAKTKTLRENGGNYISFASSDFEIEPATGVIADFSNFPSGSTGKIELNNESTDIEVEKNLGRAKIGELPADDYRMKVVIDGKVVKRGGIKVLPGRTTVVKEPIDLSVSEEVIGHVATTTTKPGPAVSTSNNTEDFIGSQDIKLFVSDEAIDAYYTTDGSDPSDSSNANRQEFTYGQEITVDSTQTVKLYAKDSEGGETTKTYGYNKVYDNAVIPETGTTMPLGALYTPSFTSFRIWSPDSNDVQLKVDANGDGEMETQDLEPLTPFEAKDGTEYTNVYHAKIDGDLAGEKYQFMIDGKEVRDPYGLMVEYDEALATGQEGTSTTEGDAELTVNTGSDTNIVMDMTNEYNWSKRPELQNREDAVIYEMHIHDFTINDSSGVPEDKRGKYLGMVEEGTTLPGEDISTGIDHLKELGVTHVQIMPFYDFATKYNHSTKEIYNWGYDPVNYNVPEERYSQSPAEYQARINEVKQMIDKFHQNGIRVTMDVVYNHSYNKEMFQNISNKYYTEGDLSGTGNSTDTGPKMVSQMMLDSLEYWVEEFNIDGFRFDLMGIHHRDEVKRWAEHLNTEYSDRNLLLYGEPWNGGSDPNSDLKVRKGNIYELVEQNVGVFNDSIRNGIRGNMNEAGGGFIFNEGSADAVKTGVKGSIANSTPSDPWADKFTYDPVQTINYMSAHDNLCIGDKILADGYEIKETTGEAAEEINNLGMGILLTAQGVTFIHGGDEMLRYKDDGSQFGEHAHNSYMWGTEINDVEWDWKQHNKASVEYFKDLIDLQQAHKAFRLETREQINKYVQSSVNNERVVAVLDGDAMTNDGLNEPWDDIIVVYNPGNEFDYNLPSGEWTQKFDKTGPVNKAINSDTATIAGREMAIFEGVATTGDVTLTINGASGDPLPENTEVEIELNGKIYNETVNADSQVVIEEVMTGDAGIDVDTDEYGKTSDTITVGEGNNEFTIDLEAEATHWKFTFDPSNSTHSGWLEDAELTEDDINSMYIIGGFNNWSEGDSDYQLSKNDDGTYTATFSVDNVSEGAEFKWLVNGETYVPGGMGNNRVVGEDAVGVEGTIE